MEFKVAVCQLLIEGGEPERNFDRLKTQIKKVKDQGATFVVFPECSDFGWTHPSGLVDAQPIPGKFSNLLADLAIKFKVFIICGLTEKSEKSIFNSSVMFDPAGELVLKHRKINITKEGKEFYSPGKKVTAIDTKYGKIAIPICSDNYWESIHIGEELGQMGVDHIFSPCSWTVDHSLTEESDIYNEKWIKPYSYLSKKFHMNILGTTSVGYIFDGPCVGRKMIGGSLFVDKNQNIKTTDINEFSSQVTVYTLKSN